MWNCGRWSGVSIWGLIKFNLWKWLCYLTKCLLWTYLHFEWGLLRPQKIFLNVACEIWTEMLHAGATWWNVTEVLFFYCARDPTVHKLTASHKKIKSGHNISTVVLKYRHIPVKNYFPCSKMAKFQSHWHFICMTWAPK